MSEFVLTASVIMAGAGIVMGAIGIYRINRAFKRTEKLENEE